MFCYSANEAIALKVSVFMEAALSQIFKSVDHYNR